MTTGELGETIGVPTRRGMSRSGLGRALRPFRDPMLLGVVPILYAAFVFTLAVLVFGEPGYDFRGTIWEPARALLDGRSPYPDPTRAAIELGNPAVYPPFITVLTAPIGFLSFSLATGVWSLLLVSAAAFALRLLGVRDWRCYALALTSAPVLEGIYWGNVTLLLLVPLAAAWCYRDRPRAAGLAVGALVAAKLFAWPLIVWFLLTRRFAAAAWAAASAVLLVFAAWALIGFDGLLDYPALLQVLQDVYAIRSFSLSTIAASLGAPATVAVILAAAAGLALLALAAWLVPRHEGDLRSFVIVVTACVAATPIVWPYYFSLFFVPIAIRWPRLAPAWFFGQVIFIVEYLPAFSLPDPEPCCRPDDVPAWVWAISHTLPEPWQAIAFTGVVTAVTVALVGNRAALRGREHVESGATGPIVES